MPREQGRGYTTSVERSRALPSPPPPRPSPPPPRVPPAGARLTTSAPLRRLSSSTPPSRLPTPACPPASQSACLQPCPPARTRWSRHRPNPWEASRRQQAAKPSPRGAKSTRSPRSRRLRRSRRSRRWSSLPPQPPQPPFLLHRHLLLPRRTRRRTRRPTRHSHPRLPPPHRQRRYRFSRPQYMSPSRGPRPCLRRAEPWRTTTTTTSSTSSRGKAGRGRGQTPLGVST